MSVRSLMLASALVMTLNVSSDADAQSVEYLAILPPESAAHAALDQSPQIRIARERMAIGHAERKRIESGSAEWELSIANDRRTDATGLRYQEQQYGLSKRMRWPNKYLLDQRIGATTDEVAEYAFEDAWHEAGRTLLASWFDCLRAQQTATLLGQQVLVLEAQLAAVTKRVTAGDAPALEQAQASAELERMRASLNQAQQAARSATLTLQQEFPDVSAPSPQLTLDTPAPLQGTDEEWLTRIMGENHEIKLAEGEVTLAEQQAERASKNRLPDPTLGFTYSDNKDGNRQLLGLNVTVPLGSTARRSEYSIAKANASIADQNARAARLKVASDGRHDVLNTHAHFEQWQQLTAVSEQSQRNAALVQRGYALGEFSYTELQSARRQALENTLAARSAQLDALESHARLLLDAHLLWVPAEDETEHTVQ
jgi:outer membrane protein, heavy metal efflux system